MDTKKYFFMLLSQEDAPVVLVKLRVVRLLGHLGGQMNRNLVTGKEQLFNRITELNVKKHNLSSGCSTK